MIGLEEFLDTFQDAGFSRRVLNRFYKSIKLSVVLSYAGHRGLPLLLKIVMRAQWPVLQKIDDPKLKIYEEVDDRELLSAFIDTIKKQKEDNSWLVLHEMALKRARFYEVIFDFSPQEIESCKQEGREHAKSLIRRKRRRRWMVGGAAAVGVAGAVLWLTSTRKK